GTAQRAHAEAVEDLAIGKAPVAPGQHVGEIGLEIGCGKMRAVKGRRAAEQDAAVPQLRPLPLLLGKMRRDLVPPRLRKGPSEGLDDQVQRLDAVNTRRRHTAISRSVPSSSWPARRTYWCKSC